jgi:hypothetical protein
MEPVNESAVTADDGDVFELVLLGAFGLGPLASFLVFGTASGVEMGLGTIAMLLAVFGVVSTIAPVRRRSDDDERTSSYRTPGEPGAGDDEHADRDGAATLVEEDGT